MGLKLTSNSTAQMSSVVAVDWPNVTHKPLDASGNAITVGTGTLTLGASKSAAISNSLTFVGTDATTMTFPTTSATIARTDAANTFTGHQTIEGVTSTGATGTGKFVFDTAPTLSTPILGVATATTLNKVTITAPATGATLTLTDGTTVTGPAATGTIMTLGNVETVTGAKTFNDGKLILAGSSSGTTTLKATATASGTLTLPAATDTLMGKATTDIMTNKTFDSAGTGNSLSVSSVAVSRGQFPGTNANDSATAGNTGELISSTIASGSAVALTSTNNQNVTSVTLTPGDWDASGAIALTGPTSTTLAFGQGSISLTSATPDSAPDRSNSQNYNSITAFNSPSAIVNQPLGPTRITISTTTSVFLIARANFAVSTCSAFGTIRARRMR